MVPVKEAVMIGKLYMYLIRLMVVEDVPDVFKFLTDNTIPIIVGHLSPVTTLVVLHLIKVILGRRVIRVEGALVRVVIQHILAADLVEARVGNDSMIMMVWSLVGRARMKQIEDLITQCDVWFLEIVVGRRLIKVPDLSKCSTCLLYTSPSPRDRG